MTDSASFTLDKSIRFTRNELLSLISSGDLNPNCHYIMTDYNRGNIGPAELLLHAVDENTLAIDVKIKTTHHPRAWSGTYNIIDDTLLSVKDHLLNDVTGVISVDNFPWGNSNVSGNLVAMAEQFNYTSGTFRNNVVTSNARLTINTSSQILRNEFSSSCDITILNGSVHDNKFEAETIAVLDTTGIIETSVFHEANQIDVGGAASIYSSEFIGSSEVTLRAGRLLNSHIAQGSRLRAPTVSGNINDLSLTEGSTLDITTTKNVQTTVLKNNSQVVLGDHNTSHTTFINTNLNTTGSTGNGISNTFFKDCNDLNNLQNISEFRIVNSELGPQVTIFSNNAAQLNFERLVASSSARILNEFGGSLLIEYSDLSNLAYIQNNQNELRVQRSSLDSGAYIRQRATADNNLVYEIVLHSRARLDFNDSVNSIQVRNCYFSEASSVTIQGTSSGTRVQTTNVIAGSQLTIEDDDRTDLTQTVVQSRSAINLIRNTGRVIAQRLLAETGGSIILQDNNQSRIYSSQASSGGSIRLRNSTATGRLYECSVSSYFILQITLTTTRRGYHAYGRRTYTVTDPAPTFGAFTQNF